MIIFIEMFFFFFFIGGVSVVIFVFVIEFVGVCYCSMMGMFLWYCWSIFFMCFVGIVYFIRDWRMFIIVIVVFGFFVLFGWL